MANGFILKLDRACEHLKHFEGEARIWLNTFPYAIVDEPDPEPPVEAFAGRAVGERRRFRVARVEPVPDRVTVILGDCLFNLRAALDHFALALAMSFTPAMTELDISRSEFPIFGRFPMSARDESRKIGCVSPTVRDAIKALQPYRRGESYADDPLWQIHDLNRIDKHRRLTLCCARPMYEGNRATAFGMQSSDEAQAILRKVSYISSTPSEYVQDAVFMRYAMNPGVPEGEMKMRPAPQAEIAFSQGGPAGGQSVISTLKSLCDYVRYAVIAPLARFL